VEKAQLKLYPNPVENYATLEFELSGTSNVLIQVYDMQGRVIRDLNLGNRSGQLKERLDFSDLPAGTYFIRMNAGNQTTVNKFIKR